MTDQPHDNEARNDDLIAVPRELLAAACYCVRKERGDGSETYKRLSALSLSKAPAPAAKSRVEQFAENAKTIPAGMVPWHGGDSAPADWDGGPVLFQDGGLMTEEKNRAPFYWDHRYDDAYFLEAGNIIAYTPKPTATGGGEREEVARIIAPHLFEPVPFHPDIDSDAIEAAVDEVLETADRILAAVIRWDSAPCRIEGLPLSEILADADRLAESVDMGWKTDASSIVDTLRRLAKHARTATTLAQPATREDALRDQLHTPGPWHVEVESDDEPNADVREVYVCHPGTLCSASVVATMTTSRWVSLQERETNARLIAACPTMAGYIRRQANRGDLEAVAIIAALSDSAKAPREDEA